MLIGAADMQKIQLLKQLMAQRGIKKLRWYHRLQKWYRWTFLSQVAPIQEKREGFVQMEPRRGRGQES